VEEAVALALAVVVALPWLWLWHLRVTAIEPSTSCEHERRVGIARVGGRVRECHASAEHQGQRTPHVRHAVETGLHSANLHERGPITSAVHVAAIARGYTSCKLGGPTNSSALNETCHCLSL
jgi:hypothetical protein